MFTFREPQRQSSIGILILFLNSLQKYARAFLPILFIWVVNIEKFSVIWLVIGLIAATLSVAFFAYLQYRNFTFYLDPDRAEFVISEGILNKTVTIIQLNKIQQVNITQSLLQRIIGVFSLEVDTAGSTKKEGRISAVSHELAIALKEQLLESSNNLPSESAPESVATAKPFISIGFSSLLKIGITSNYLKSFGLILAFLATVYENVRQYAEYSKYDTNQINDFVNQQDVLTAVGIVVIILFTTTIVINLIRVLVRYYNYKISQQQESLLLSFGLINTKSTILRPERIQITSVSQNYLQRKMDILEIKVKQAASGNVKEQRKSVIEIPGCNSSERDAILKLLYSVIPEKGVMLRPNFRKLGFSIFLIIIVPLSVFYSLAYYAEPRFFDFTAFAILYAVFALSVLFFAFRNYRLFIHDRFIIKQSGAWDITNSIIEPGKIQALSTSQLFWHKSLNIGSLTIHTAAGDLHFQLGNFNAIANFVNLWLYELERSDSNWM